MKTKSVLFLLTPLCLLYLFLACNKNNEQAAPMDPDTGLIQDAKNYFVKEVLPDKLTQSAVVERNNRLPLGKIANWRMANVQDLRWGKTVVVPLNLPNIYNNRYSRSKAVP